MFQTLLLKYIENNCQSFLVFSILVLVLIWVYNTNYFRMVYYLSKIPGPKSYPIIGIAYLSIGKTHAELTQLTFDFINKFTPILSASIGPIPVIAISKPEYVQQILTNHNGLEKPWLMTHIAVDIAGDSILSAPVPKWKRIRRKAVRGFAPNILKTYFKVMIESSLILSQKLEDKLNDSKSFDILEYLSKASMDSVAKSTLGVNANIQDSGSILYHSMQGVFKTAFERLDKPWLLIDFIFHASKNFKKFIANKNVINELAEKIISEKRCQNTLNKNNLSSTDKHFTKSFLEILLDVTEHDPLFDDKQLKDEVIFMIIAGFETTANALGYIFLNLAARRDIQEKVCEELFEVLGDPNRIIDLDDLPKLKYMEMVIKESMRLHPTIPFIARKITKDIRLDNYLIPEGTSVGIPIFCIHRNAQYWKDPLKFDPERFAVEHIKSCHPYSYLPFGGGPRNCLGIRYAWMLMKAFIATLLARYEFHTDLNINELQFEIELSLKLLGGHQVRITRRKRI